VMIMRVLVSLVPFVLMVWCGQETTALSIEDNLGLQHNRELTVEQRDLLKTLSGLNELTSKYMYPDQQLHKELQDRSLRAQVPAKVRSPCKKLFWKTFSSC
uniref:Somatostatin/Cortistatin C-terminal domain-containing protein n=2 Tax=Oncorhynchus tshawytscha TaxID=74940 RepID=A0A8C8JVL3_ONCTS